MGHRGIGVGVGILRGAIRQLENFKSCEMELNDYTHVQMSQNTPTADNMARSAEKSGNNNNLIRDWHILIHESQVGAASGGYVGVGTATSSTFKAAWHSHESMHLLLSW